MSKTGRQGGSARMLLAFVRTYPGRTSLALLALIVAGVLDGLGLSLLLSMLNLATGATEDPSMPERVALEVVEALGLEPTTLSLLVLGVVMIAIKAMIVLLANRQVGYTVAHVATDLRLQLIQAVMNSRWRYYLAQPVGRLSNAVATEAHRASEGFFHGAVMATQTISALIYASLALLISWQASLIALAFGGALLGILHFLVRIAGRAGRDQTGLLKSLLSVMTDQLGAVKPLKAMAREQHVDRMLSSQTRDLKKALKSQVIAKAGLTALQEPLLAILVGVGFFFFLVQMSLPMGTVMVMIFLIARSVNHLAKAQRALQHMAISESAYWSLRATTEEAEDQREPARGHLVPSLDKAIRFESVSFGYGERPVIDQLSMTIPAGKLTVLCGPSGSGKTTLIDLVAALLHTDSGQILVDDQRLDEIDHHRWRRLIGYVPQDPLLVNDTVFHNLALGDPTLTEDDARRALEQADAWDFIAQLPQGMNTLLGERGGRLSGGQRQRLAIARALIHQPRLLILDEATSNLDSVSEAAVIETIQHLKDQLTLLAVSHDEGLVKAADQVIRIESGRRVEAGLV
ncbi:MAG: ABC transporter ATP-binding protein [Wenzhouxiangella sp.]|nr:ABC transporter ATP-binding protein [Wenzhouxiangella sp.]MCH8478522.1 ABC transporter ATP-binding protein/permease [Wenzhouxiangella sp.]TVR95772.1 MAG: ABC transporter ATP-binding protein [Wenzhouxiangellaceae bacterium]